MNAPWWYAITASLAAAGAAVPLNAQPGPPTPAPLPPMKEALNPSLSPDEYRVGNRQARDLWDAAQHFPGKYKDLSFTLTVRGDGGSFSRYQKVRWTRVFHTDSNENATRVEFIDQGDQAAEIWSLTRQGRLFQILDFAEKSLTTVELKERLVAPAEAFWTEPYWWGWSGLAEPATLDGNFQFQPDQSVHGVTCRVISFGDGPVAPLPADPPAAPPPRAPTDPALLDFQSRYSTAWIAPDGHAARVARTWWKARRGEISKDAVTFDMDDSKSNAGLADADLELHAPPGWSERSLRPDELDLPHSRRAGLPAFTLTDTAGAVVTDRTLPDRTLLVFWTPWAKQTPAMFAELKKLREALKPLGVPLTLVCIWAQDDDAPARALREHGWDGPSLLRGERLARRLGIGTVPLALQPAAKHEPLNSGILVDTLTITSLLGPAAP